MAAIPLSLPKRPPTRVAADTLTPHAQPTPRGLRQACDFRAQCLVKYPGRAEFHSAAEHLHAGLLEADPQVISFVPQPLRLRVGRRRYTPDAYVLHLDGTRQVIELKPRGEMDPAIRDPVAAFLAQHGLTFVVISNEAVLERGLEAENGLEIARRLYLARDIDTTTAEAALLQRVAAEHTLTLIDLVSPNDRAGSYLDEVALLRLIHRGVLDADLAHRRLGFDTEVRRCG